LVCPPPPPLMPQARTPLRASFRYFLSGSRRGDTRHEISHSAWQSTHASHLRKRFWASRGGRRRGREASTQSAPVMTKQRACPASAPLRRAPGAQHKQLSIQVWHRHTRRFAAQHQTSSVERRSDLRGSTTTVTDAEAENNDAER
jgi:hypothetical protein